jgi:hypothetical protein
MGPPTSKRLQGAQVKRIILVGHLLLMPSSLLRLGGKATHIGRTRP